MTSTTSARRRAILCLSAFCLLAALALSSCVATTPIDEDKLPPKEEVSDGTSPDDEPDEPTPAPEAPTHRILIASDTHCTDLMDWYGLSDEERMQLWLDSVWAEHTRQPFDLIIIAGDISLDTHDGQTCYTKGYSTSEIFVEEYVAYLPDVPVYILAGNHESIPEDDWEALTGNARQCTAVVGNNTFIMLDSFRDSMGEEYIPDAYTQADVAYIREQMDAYPENNVYLVAHTFPIDEGMGGESDAFREVLCDERVIGLFGGHTHLNTVVRYNESCGNKLQAQTGNFSYTHGPVSTSFWGFRDLVITEDSAVTSYIMVECDAVVDGAERHFERRLTEVVDFMDPSSLNDYRAADGTVYTLLYELVDTASISGDAGFAGEDPAQVLDNQKHTKWCLNEPSDGEVCMQWAMTEPVELAGYVFTTGNDAPERTPKSWTLYAGDHPDELFELDVREGVTLPTEFRADSQVFVIEDPTAYQYYRLVITENAGDADIHQFSELILLGAGEAK